MNATADYLAHYEAIAAVSARMLAAARKALWNELIELQDEYRALVDMLRDMDAGTLQPITPSEPMKCRRRQTVLRCSLR